MHDRRDWALYAKTAHTNTHVPNYFRRLDCGKNRALFRNRRVAHHYVGTTNNCYFQSNFARDSNGQSANRYLPTNHFLTLDR